MTLPTPLEDLAAIVHEMSVAVNAYSVELIPITHHDARRWRNRIAEALEAQAILEVLLRQELTELRTAMLEAQAMIREARGLL